MVRRMQLTFSAPLSAPLNSTPSGLIERVLTIDSVDMLLMSVPSGNFHVLTLRPPAEPEAKVTAQGGMSYRSGAKVENGKAMERDVHSCG